MQKLTPSALLLIAACAFPTGVNAQNTYKCGHSYSQFPCPGGVVLDPRDGRDSSQKKQADSATLRDARVADALETERRQLERQELQANTPRRLSGEAPPVQAQGMTGVQPAKSLKKNVRPSYFTALAPSEKKKPKASKTKARDN